MYSGERLTHLQALAGLLPDHGLVSRLVGGDHPVLWVWHPPTGRQTMVFATPVAAGWLFLWSNGGQRGADDLDEAALALKQALAEPG
ncbi:MAG: hypothetical protein HOY71_54450 [Nonomuraea sp.]|nr:hypothetical protein [Nonomuraea sp.]